METQSVSAEELAASIVDIALALGVPISSSAKDLAQLHKEIETQLGARADKLFTLAEKKAKGLTPNKEIEKLARAMHATAGHSSIARKPIEGTIHFPVHPTQPQNANAFPLRSAIPPKHWSHQSQLADSKLVTTRRGVHAIRGPGRHSGK